MLGQNPAKSRKTVNTIFRSIGRSDCFCDSGFMGETAQAHKLYGNSSCDYGHDYSYWTITVCSESSLKLL